MAKKNEEAAGGVNEKLKALQAAMAKIEKDFGKGTIMKLGDETTQPVDVIPSGSILLDNALGVGGYPRGRIVEIFGPESSGKTTMALGSRHSRPADTFGGGRYNSYRLCCSPYAESRNRRRDG